MVGYSGSTAMKPLSQSPATRRRRTAVIAALALALGVVGMVASKRDMPPGPPPVDGADRVSELALVLAEMNRLEARKREAFLAYARDAAPRAPSEVGSLQDKAIQQQREIVRVLEGALSELDRYAATRANLYFDRVFEAHELAAGNHACVLSSQQQALGVLSLVAPDDAATLAQVAAGDAQVAAGEALRELIAARDLARGSRLRTPDEREYEHHTFHLVRAERRQAELPAELIRLAKRAGELEAMAQQLVRDLEKSADGSRAEFERQAEAVSAARADIARRQHAAEKSLARAPDDVARHRPKVAEYEARLAVAPQAPTPEDRKLAGLQQDAILSQLRAIELQTSARAALVKLPATENPGGVADLRARPAIPAEPGDLNQREFVLDQDIRAAFRRVHAMDRVMLCRLPWPDAMKLTDLAPVLRPDAVTASARAMLDQTRRLVTAACRDRPEAIEAAATADPEDPARDLTAPPGGIRLLPGGPGGPPPLDAETVALPAFSLLEREASPPPAWVFVDRWQILGPFDNPKRANLDTVYPPESVVDLAAVYPGKHGVAVGWESVRSDTPEVVPPFAAYNRERPVAGLAPDLSALHNLQYAVYYACSELHFERDCELWVAIGSDDHSKLWINDRLVWSSGRHLKAWKADEGYRKVRFQAGVNRVLFRIENGNDRTGFSLLIGMQG